MLKNKITTITAKSEKDDYFKIDEIIDIYNKEERNVYQGKIMEISGDVILVENLKTRKEELYSKSDKNKIIFKQWIPGRTPHIFNLVDIELPNTNNWVEGIITKINQDKKEILIKYINKSRFKQTNEEWVNINSKRISQIGTYTKYKKDKKDNKIFTSKEINEKLYKNRKLVSLTNEQENKLKNKKEQNDYNIKPILKDGNCLFRAISYQIYGDEKYHSILREKCMDYINIEKNFFEQFIEGDFDEYINLKRKNGIWGDDIEIQALSEIYNRPIEIYSGGIKLLKTFHENVFGFNFKKSNGKDVKIIPIRISYHGNKHYNSLEPISEEKLKEFKGGFIKVKPGLYEDNVLFEAKENEKKIIKNIELDENNIKEKSRINFVENKKNKNLDDILLKQIKGEEINNEKLKENDKKENDYKKENDNKKENDKKENEEKNEKKDEDINIKEKNEKKIDNDDYLSNELIKTALEFGYTLDEAVRVWSVCGDNQEMFLNYLLSKNEKE